MMNLTKRSSGAGSLRLLAALRAYTRVNVIRETDGRTYFAVADGLIAAGQQTSLTTANAAAAEPRRGGGRPHGGSIRQRRKPCCKSVENP